MRLLQKLIHVFTISLLIAASLSWKSDKPLIQLRVFHSTNEIQYSILFPPSQISFLIQHPKTRPFACPLEFCHTTGIQIFRGTRTPALAVILGHQMIHHQLRSWRSGPWDYSQWDDRGTALKVGCLQYMLFILRPFAEMNVICSW